jgi:hypothetical protein
LYTDKNEINQALQSIGIEGLELLNFSGQIHNTVWHSTNCEIQGISKQSMGPFNWFFIQDKLTATCCNLAELMEDITPKGVSQTLKVLAGLKLLEKSLATYLNENAMQPILERNPLLASAEFQNRLDELSGAISHNLIKLPGKSGGKINTTTIFQLAEKLDDEIIALHKLYFSNPLYLKELKTLTYQILDLPSNDDLVIIGSTIESTLTHYLDSEIGSLLLEALKNTFLASTGRYKTSTKTKIVSTIPLWVYHALVELGGKRWLSQPYSSLSPETLEIAATLWVENSGNTLDSFDACIEAAISCNLK